MKSTRHTFGRLRRPVLSATAAGFALAAAASTAFAQGAPQPQLRVGQPAWLGYLIMFVLLAAIMSVSLMPSKRSHQD